MLLGVAPMDWISDAVFRIITKKVFEDYWTIDDSLFLRTEFMNVHGYVINPNKVIRHIIHTEYETPLIAQLYGSDPEWVLKSFQEVEQKYGKGFAGLELNMWCPARKVVDSGCGVGMLRDREKSLNLVKQLSEKLQIPFSIKTRSWLTEIDKKEQLKYIVELSKYCSMITIHSRTFAEWYTGNPSWEYLYRIKDTVVKNWNPECKIIWNGGIKTYENCRERLWNLDGVMIWQSAIWNPWVFVSHNPSLEEKKNIILQHLQLFAQFEVYVKQQIYSFVWDVFPFPNLSTLESIDLKDNYWDISFSVIEFRKFLFNYVKWIEWSKEFKIAITQIKDYNKLVEKIEEFFNVY